MPGQSEVGRARVVLDKEKVAMFRARRVDLRALGFNVPTFVSPREEIVSAPRAVRVSTLPTLAIVYWQGASRTRNQRPEFGARVLRQRSVVLDGAAVPLCFPPAICLSVRRHLFSSGATHTFAVYVVSLEFIRKKDEHQSFFRLSFVFLNLFWHGACPSSLRDRVQQPLSRVDDGGVHSTNSAIHRMTERLPPPTERSTLVILVRIDFRDSNWTTGAIISEKKNSRFTPSRLP
ncbi:unnamed protein product, partial [Scytosiphon promiscuus]